LWLDGGHNPAGGQVIAQTLAELDERAPKQVALVVGMLAQKDATGFLKQFAGLVRHVATVAIEGSEAALDAQTLAGLARSAGLDAEPATGIESAIRRLQERAGEPLRILICGSLYLAGQVLALQAGVQAQAN
jgi:dihydrofolate synthase/folylpolyglutamate synthase